MDKPRTTLLGHIVYPKDGSPERFEPLKPTPRTEAQTPRTEHAAFRSRYGDHVPTDFARELERERNELEQTVARLRAALKSVVHHWSEFGPDGLDEAMHHAAAALKKEPG